MDALAASKSMTQEKQRATTMVTTASSSSSSSSPAVVLPQWRDAVAGAGAGVFSRTVMAPLERLKLLKQLQTTTKHATLVTHQPSVWRILMQVYHEQGLFSFWRGNLPAAIRVAGTASINFTCMDYYKRLLVEQGLVSGTTSTQERTSKFLISLLAGGMAGATSTSIMYPFEFARTRLAMDMGKDDVKSLLTTTKAATGTTIAKPTPREYNGMGDVLTKIIQSDGPLGLYRGYGIALFGGIFYRVLYLGGYDIVKNELNGSTSSSGGGWTSRIVAAQTISLVSGTLSYPLDSVRRRMMMQSGTANAGGVATAVPYRNSWQCIAYIWRTEGLAGFYLGLGPNLLRSVGGALLLVAYDAFRDVLTTT